MRQLSRSSIGESKAVTNLAIGQDFDFLVFPFAENVQALVSNCLEKYLAVFLCKIVLSLDTEQATPDCIWPDALNFICL